MERPSLADYFDASHDWLAEVQQGNGPADGAPEGRLVLPIRPVIVFVDSLLPSRQADADEHYYPVVVLTGEL
jgi:hypothetical protein